MTQTVALPLTAGPGPYPYEPPYGVASNRIQTLGGKLALGRWLLGRAKFRTKKELAKLVRELSPLPKVPDLIEPLRPEPAPPLATNASAADTSPPPNDARSSSVMADGAATSTRTVGAAARRATWSYIT